MSSPTGSPIDSTNLNRNLDYIAKMTSHKDKITAYRYYYDKDTHSIEKRNILIRGLEVFIRFFKTDETLKAEDLREVNKFVNSLADDLDVRRSHLLKGVDIPKIDLVITNFKKLPYKPADLTRSTVQKLSEICFKQKTEWKNETRKQEVKPLGSDKQKVSTHSKIDIEAQNVKESSSTSKKENQSDKTSLDMRGDIRATKFLKYLMNDQQNPKKWDLIDKPGSVDVGDLSVEEMVFLFKAAKYYDTILEKLITDETSKTTTDQTKKSDPEVLSRYQAERETLSQLATNAKNKFDLTFLTKENNDELFKLLTDDQPNSVLFENISSLTNSSSSKGVLDLNKILELIGHADKILECILKEEAESDKAVQVNISNGATVKVAEAAKHQFINNPLLKNTLTNVATVYAKRLNMTLNYNKENSSPEIRYEKMLKDELWVKLCSIVPPTEQDEFAKQILDLTPEQFQKTKFEHETYRVARESLKSVGKRDPALVTNLDPDVNAIERRYDRVINYITNLEAGPIKDYLSDPAKRNRVISEALIIPNVGDLEMRYQQASRDKPNVSILIDDFKKAPRVDENLHSRLIALLNDDIRKFGLISRLEFNKIVEYRDFIETADSFVKFMNEFRMESKDDQRLYALNEPLQEAETKFPDFQAKVPERILKGYNSAKKSLGDLLFSQEISHMRAHIKQTLNVNNEPLSPEILYEKMLNDEQWKKICSTRPPTEQDEFAEQILNLTPEQFQKIKTDHKIYLEASNKLRLVGKRDRVLEATDPDVNTIERRYDRVVNYIANLEAGSPIKNYLSEPAKRNRVISEVLIINNVSDLETRYQKALGDEQIISTLIQDFKNAPRVDENLHSRMLHAPLNEDIEAFGLISKTEFNKITEYKQFINTAESVVKDVSALLKQDTLRVANQLADVENKILIVETKSPEFINKIPEELLNRYTDAKETSNSRATVMRKKISNLINKSDFDSLISLSNKSVRSKAALNDYKALEVKFLAIVRLGGTELVQDFEAYKKMINLLGVRQLPYRVRALHNAIQANEPLNEIEEEFKNIERSWLLYPEYKDLVPEDPRLFDNLQREVGIVQSTISQLKKLKQQA